MSLGDIKDKLYKKEEEKNLSSHDESQYDPHIGGLPGSGSLGPADVWGQENGGLDLNQKKSIKKGAIILGGIVFIIFLMVAVFFIRKATFSLDRVAVSITGLNQAESGKLLTYEIVCSNNNQATLKGAVLKIGYPSDFKPEENADFTEEGPVSGKFSLGDIPAHSTKKIIFNGRAYSPRGALIYVKADLTYSPSGFSSQYVTSNQLGVNVTTSPISLEIMAPQNVASGDEVNYLINYKNTGERDFEGLRIKMDYPDGFTFSTSDPKSFEGNNIWYIGTLTPGQSGKITVSGKLEGEGAQVKGVKAYVGSVESDQFVSYSEESTDTKIASSPLVISQLVNNAASLNTSAGDTLRFRLDYKNTGEQGLSNLIITEKLETDILDFKEADFAGGAYDTTTKTITWKASDHSELRNLAPNQSGFLQFMVKVKEMIPINGANDKNFVISAVAKIDSPDIPTPISMNKIIAGNKIDIRLNSKLVVDVKGYHNDSNITNDGPIPPKVGQETTYAIHWLASNVSNDINNARIEAVLPTGATMTGKIYPEDAKITYNERNNSIVWEIGNMAAGTGILSAPKEASFQVKIKPSVDQVNRFADLIGPSTFYAKDAFTGDDLSSTAGIKNTELQEDGSLGYNYKVVP